MNKQLLLQYIEGTLNPAQTEKVLSWIAESDENAAVFAALKADWVFQHLPNTTLSEEQAERLMREKRPRSKSYKVMQTLVRVAAVLFIPVTGLAVYFMLNQPPPLVVQAPQLYTPPQHATLLSYHTNPGVKGLVVLPDSSQVWLNSCSTIKCPGEFDDAARYVELSGEAYFEVKKNKEWPMQVKTPKGITIIVKGTSFNVSSYENDSDFKFTLVSGDVTLLREKNNEAITVKPEDVIIIPDRAEVMTFHKSKDIYYNTAWKEGFLLFEDTPMDEVIKKIERWYGVDITINDHAILGYRFTASFNSESISRVLDLLKITSNINYRIKENQVTLFLPKG